MASAYNVLLNELPLRLTVTVKCTVYWFGRDLELGGYHDVAAWRLVVASWRVVVALGPRGCQELRT